MSDIKNLRFGVCDVCLKPICQCPKPTAPPHALTREQTHEGECLSCIKLADTLTQQAQEIRINDLEGRLAIAEDWNKRSFKEYETEMNGVLGKLNDARQDAARYKQFVEWTSTADSEVWAFQIREKAQRVLQGLE